MVGSVGEASVGELGRRLDGGLVLPDDEGYDAARDVWNGLVNRYPAVVVRAATADDVAAAVGFAREHDLPLSV